MDDLGVKPVVPKRHDSGIAATGRGRNEAKCRISAEAGEQILSALQNTPFDLVDSNLVQQGQTRAQGVDAQHVGATGLKPTP